MGGELLIYGRNQTISQSAQFGTSSKLGLKNPCGQKTLPPFDFNILAISAGVTMLLCLVSMEAYNWLDNSRIRHSCASCGNIIYGTADNMKGLWLLQAGTLDDTSAVHPEMHMWIQNAQPWITLPEGVPSWETQADNVAEMLQAAVDYRQSINSIHG